MKDHFTGMNIKQKLIIKIPQMNLDKISNFAGVNRLFALVYPNRNDDVKRFKAKRYYVPQKV